jgi:nucleoside phosphorylase
VPFSAIRGVTDDGRDHAENSFESNLNLASHAAAKTMLHYVGIE